MKDFVAVGYACMDIYDDLGKKYPTGNGVDVIAHLSKAGYDVALVSAVGDDTYGKEFIEFCEDMEFDTSHVHVEEGDTAQIHMSLIDGDRVHGKIIDGVLANFSLTKEDRAFIKEFKYLHTDYFGRIYGMLGEFQQAGCKIVFDFSSFINDKDFEMIAPYVDIGQISVEGFSQETKKIMQYMHCLGIKICIATAGSQGALAYDGKNFYYQEALDPQEIVNTVGCGDAFLAGFLMGDAASKPIEECLLLGAKSSQKIIQKFEPY